ncbi:hypothetical protein BJ742DRAFT_121566 [Cladochytrium replicatum]|nr:hypothetical protein BJ742DRAFT_121566 [Cladochytrium replicatum]
MVEEMSLPIPWIQGQNSPAEEDQHQKDLFIVEPGQGDLYRYELGSTIRKMPYSIKYLVQNVVPRTLGEFSYTGDKRTMLYAIDPLSGKVLRSYGGNRDDSRDGKIIEDEEIDEDITDRAIFVGRTEYFVEIWDIKSDKLRWNITYGEYSHTGPDGLFTPPMMGGAPVQQKTPRIQMAGGFDGRFALADGDKRVEWTVKFKSPAVNAFTIAPAELPSCGFSLSKAFSLASTHTSQKISSMFDVFRKRNAYVGRIDDSFYLLNGEQFAMIDGSVDPSIDGPQTDDVEPIETSSLCTPLWRSLRGPQKAILDLEKGQQGSDWEECRWEDDDSCMVGLVEVRVDDRSPSVIVKEKYEMVTGKINQKVEAIGSVLRRLIYSVGLFFSLFFFYRYRNRFRRRSSRDYESIDMKLVANDIKYPASSAETNQNLADPVLEAEALTQKVEERKPGRRRRRRGNRGANFDTDKDGESGAEKEFPDAVQEVNDRKPSEEGDQSKDSTSAKVAEGSQPSEPREEITTNGLKYLSVSETVLGKCSQTPIQSGRDIFYVQAMEVTVPWYSREHSRDVMSLLSAYSSTSTKLLPTGE